jgi:hypothetical protein
MEQKNLEVEELTQKLRDAEYALSDEHQKSETRKTKLGNFQFLYFFLNYFLFYF